jgi:chromatin remodeling complex protein RSC6
MVKRMRGISRATSYLLSGIFLLVFVPGTSWAQVSDKFLNEAKTLAKLEDDFFKKRLNNDLKGAYNYQHPDYKEKISIEEFLYFEGRLESDYRNGVMPHIS